MNFFATGSPYLGHPLLTRERTVREIEFLLGQIELPAAAPILDIGCGFGRHAIYLAELGYDVTAIDPSAEMIQAAKAAADLAGVSINWLVASGEDLATLPGKFALISCLFTTLGQINEGYNDNRAMLPLIAAVLAPGGQFVVEVPNRPVALKALKADDRFGSDSHYTEIKRTFDAQNDVVDEHFQLVSPEETKQFHLRYRLYSEETLTALLAAAGLRRVQGWGDYQGAELNAHSPTLLLVCEAAS